MKNILFLLLLCVTKIFAQSDQLLTPKQLRADADYYFEMLYARHPNPYYYYSLDEFESKKNEIYSQLNRPLTHEQFAWIIGEMNSYVDMHSLIKIFFNAHWRKNPTDSNLRYFPNIRFKDEKVYLKKNGIEISKINGVKVSEIIQDIKKYINWKLSYERNTYTLEESFSFFLMNKYNFKAPFEVLFSNSDKIQVLEGYAFYDILNEASGGLRGGKDDFSIYTIYPASSIAIFNLMNFNIQQRDGLKEKLNNFFKEVDSLQIKNIFYDLTINGGGDYDVLCNEGAKALNIIKHGSIHIRFNKIQRINNFNKKFKVDDVISLSNKNSYRIPAERKLYILQGCNTMSGGDYFCRIVTENKLGILVGQDTGELTTAFSSAITDMMPNSKIQFSIPTALHDFSDYFKHETLHPDVYWDVNNTRKFTEEELIDIIKHCKK